MRFRPLSAEEYDELYLIYSEFRNVGIQKPKTVRLLPLPSIGGEDVDIDKRIDYIYEPSDEVLLDQLLPMYLRVLIYRALLETSAGENGARMVAMDNATTNCEEMVQLPEPEIQQGEAAGHHDGAHGHRGRHRGPQGRLINRTGPLRVALALNEPRRKTLFTGESYEYRNDCTGHRAGCRRGVRRRANFPPS